MRPLDGITVITLEHAIAAPFCTRQLADLGARVIKIERPESGDFARGYDERVRGLSSHFVWTNRSKESLTLDLKHAFAPRILRLLLERADVLVQNLAPGAAERLGLSFESLRATLPGLIVCDISGYGADGPYRDKKAYDLLIQSESGFLSTTGTREEPCKAACSVADIAPGMYAYTNVLTALMTRLKTRRGCRIDVSMLESMVEWMGYPTYYAFDGGRATPAERRLACNHLSLRPFRNGRWPDGHARPAERARVAYVLRQGPECARARVRRALLQQRSPGCCQGDSEGCHRGRLLDAQRRASHCASGRGAHRKRPCGFSLKLSASLR